MDIFHKNSPLLYQTLTNFYHLKQRLLFFNIPSLFYISKNILVYSWRNDLQRTLIINTDWNNIYTILTCLSARYYFKNHLCLWYLNSYIQTTYPVWQSKIIWKNNSVHGATSISKFQRVKVKWIFSIKIVLCYRKL